MGVSREYSAKLEVAVLNAWLLKDFAWVLLIHMLAWPAALIAILLQFHQLVLEWKISSDAVNVHSLAALMWISGNAVWMTSELLFDTSTCYDPIAKVSIFPWHKGPLAGDNKQAYDAGVMYARGIFISALLMLSVFYLAKLFYFAKLTILKSSQAARSTNPQEDSEESGAPAEELVWGFMERDLYMIVYIGPWLLKDLLWTFESMYPALLCSAVVLALMVDCLRRFGSAGSAVEINWVIGNTIWLFAEQGIKTPELSPRIIAGSFLLIGCALTGNVYTQAQASAKAFPGEAAADTCERASLMGRSGIGG